MIAAYGPILIVLEALETFAQHVRPLLFRRPKSVVDWCDEAPGKSTSPSHSAV